MAQLLAAGMVGHPGATLEDSVARLFEPESAAPLCELAGFSEPIAIRYRAVEGGPQEARARLHWLLDQAMGQLFEQHPLAASERRSVPVFIGSSCYGIAIAESRYRTQYASSPATAVPLPLQGFHQIHHHLRDSYGLLGPDFAIHTACTSTANALLNARAAIHAGMGDYALVIGLESFNATTLSGFQAMQLVSPDAMRPFDRGRNGLILGEGCGALLLGRGQGPLSLVGGATCCDSYSISTANPDGSSIARVMAAALDSARIAREEVVAIKAHGTATPLNDNSEAAGMRGLFGTPPPFFSLKAHTGHTLGSCGVMETALTAACLARGSLPASGGLREPDPGLAVTPLRRNLPAPAGYYLLNFFGFGGNNASLVLRYQGAGG
ncbi:MAG: beta-ketoacyl synthase N-terminal-like domain-containing protein [Parahaliea sp.]